MMRKYASKMEYETVKYNKRREENRAYNRAYYQAHKAERNKNSRDYYKKNREAALAQKKVYLMDNHAEIIKKKRKFYRENRARICADQVRRYHAGGKLVRMGLVQPWAKARSLDSAQVKAAATPSLSLSQIASRLRKS